MPRQPQQRAASASPSWKRIRPELASTLTLGTDDEAYYLLVRTSGGWQASPANALIADFKMKPEISHQSQRLWRRKQESVRTFADAVAALLESAPFRARASDPASSPIALVPLPTHQPKSHPLHDDRLARLCALASAGQPHVFLADAFDARVETTAAHEGGQRAIAAIAEAFTLGPITTPEGPPRLVILVDDVLTTGAHFVACRDLIRAQNAGVPVVGVFLAMQMSEGIDYPVPLEPDQRVPIGAAPSRLPQATLRTISTPPTWNTATPPAFPGHAAPIPSATASPAFPGHAAPIPSATASATPPEHAALSAAGNPPTTTAGNYPNNRTAPAAPATGEHLNARFGAQPIQPTQAANVPYGHPQQPQQTPFARQPPAAPLPSRPWTPAEIRRHRRACSPAVRGCKRIAQFLAVSAIAIWALYGPDCTTIPNIEQLVPATFLTPLFFAFLMQFPNKPPIFPNAAVPPEAQLAILIILALSELELVCGPITHALSAHTRKSLERRH